jgi:hypothetical protein
MKKNKSMENRDNLEDQKIDFNKLLSENKTEDIIRKKEIEESEKGIDKFLEMKTKSAGDDIKKIDNGKPYRYIIRAKVTND